MGEGTQGHTATCRAQGRDDLSKQPGFPCPGRTLDESEILGGHRRRACSNLPFIQSAGCELFLRSLMSCRIRRWLVSPLQNRAHPFIFETRRHHRPEASAQAQRPSIDAISLTDREAGPVACRASAESIRLQHYPAGRNLVTPISEPASSLEIESVAHDQSIALAKLAQVFLGAKHMGALGLNSFKDRSLDAFSFKHTLIG